MASFTPLSSQLSSLYKMCTFVSSNECPLSFKCTKTAESWNELLGLKKHKDMMFVEDFFPEDPLPFRRIFNKHHIPVILKPSNTLRQRLYTPKTHTTHPKTQPGICSPMQQRIHPPVYWRNQTTIKHMQGSTQESQLFRAGLRFLPTL